MKVDLVSPLAPEACWTQVYARFDGELPALPTRAAWTLARSVASGVAFPAPGEPLQLYGRRSGTSITIRAVGVVNWTGRASYAQVEFSGTLTALRGGTRIAGETADTPPRFFTRFWLGFSAFAGGAICLSVAAGRNTLATALPFLVGFAVLAVVGLLFSRYMRGLGDEVGRQLVEEIRGAVEAEPSH